MSKRRVFEAMRSDGTIVKRSTDRGRTYTHCVVTWHEAKPERTGPNGRIWPPSLAGWGRNSEWRSRLDLAQALARSYDRMPGVRAEILEAREVSKP